MSRFTFDPSVEVCSLWSPDGTRIIFSSNRSGVFNAYSKNSGGAGAEELLFTSEFNTFVDDWSTKTVGGEHLIYETNLPDTRWDLYVMPLFGDRKPFPYLNSKFNENHAQFSPDGRWVAYATDESGRAEVYVQSFPVSGGKWQISTEGGDQPQWRLDGKELFYLTPDRRIMSVAVSSEPVFEAGAPVPLFTTRIETTSLVDDRNNYVPAPDGQRFLVNNLVEDANTRPISLILNWSSKLRP